MECPTRKAAYYTKKEAKKGARSLLFRHKGKHGKLMPFRCGECGMWHLGHSTAAIRAAYRR